MTPGEEHIQGDGAAPLVTGTQEAGAPAVLRWRRSGPAVRLPGTPSSEELAFDWTLSNSDLTFVRGHRGKQNLLQIAIQVCILRKHGRFLSDYSRVAAPILGYLCAQLEIEPIAQLSGRARSSTESVYLREVASHLGWRVFDQEAERALQRWTREQVADRLYVEDLVEKAEAFLLRRRTILPGRWAFEQTVNEGYRGAERHVFERMAARIPEETKTAIDRLLGMDDAPLPADKSDFFRFAEYPPEGKAFHIRTYLERYEEIRRLQLKPIALSGVGPELLRRLSEAVSTFDVWQLRRFNDDKRYALAAAFLYETRRQLLDYLVEMHAQFMTETMRRSRNEYEKQHQALRKRVRVGVTTLRSLGELMLSLGAEEDMTTGELLSRFDADRLAEAVAVCAEFEHLERYGFLDLLHGKYPNFRKYFRFFATLDFACEPGSEPILQALDLLRRLDRGEVKTLPSDLDLSFVPELWRPAMRSPKQWVRRRTWEFALALEIKDRLRSGDVFLPESRRHTSFWTLCYDEVSWNRVREQAFADLQLPREASEAIERLLRAFHDQAEQTERGLAGNPYARVEDGRLRVQREKKIEEPAATAELRQLVRRALPKVRIERLLMEVDARCGFSRHLVPATGTSLAGSGSQASLPPERHYAALMATLVAHGTNLGIYAMGQSTEAVTVAQLQHMSRTRLRVETIERANAELVNYHRQLPASQYWGTGQVASSDGQRFGVRESTLLSSVYPRYFGYYDRVVSVYTHLSDQYGVFKTQVISCAEREALYVLVGLLAHETNLPVRIHITDSHGYTDSLFGLCYLLGFTFMPRFRDLSKTRLFGPAAGAGEDLFGVRRYPKLDTVFSGSINPDLIAEQWDSLVRVAASLKNRIIDASVVMKRLIAGGSSNRLAKALVQLGRLVKSVYVLRFIDDEELRRLVRRQLNRGESRHDLARKVFYADQGMFRKGDYAQMMNKASCLSLLSNAILTYNTERIGQVLRLAGEQNRVFTPEAISHVSPLMRRHVIVNGTYDFTLRGVEGRGQLFV